MIFVGNELGTNIRSCCEAFNKDSSLMNFKKIVANISDNCDANLCVSLARLQRIFAVAFFFIVNPSHMS